jgi:error-prone DNA polymerase
LAASICIAATISAYQPIDVGGPVVHRQHSNEVLISRARLPLQDIMTCIREHCTLVDGVTVATQRRTASEIPTEMQRLFIQWPSCDPRHAR